MISVSILTYSALEHAKRCVQAVLERSTLPYELILTANGNPAAAEFFQSVAAQHAHVRVVVNETNEGFQIPNIRALAQTTTEYFVMLNDDTIVPPRWLEAMVEPFTKNPKAALTAPRGTCCALNEKFHGYVGGRVEYLEGSCLMGKTEILKKHGLFSPHLCVSPDTKVLTSNLQWKRIDTLALGDELISCEEYPEMEKKGAGRRFKPATVLGLCSRETECVRITLDDGASVICSTEHRWLTKKPLPLGSKYEWRKSNELREGFRMLAPFRVWDTETSFDSGWLSGIFDGEGFVRIGGRKTDFNNGNSSVGVGMVQLPGLVLSRAEELLSKMGIDYIRRLHSQGRNSPVFNLEINKKKFGMELIGRLRPVRLMDKARMLWQNRCIRSRLTDDAKRIKSIESVGLHPVISMGTSTRTFFANGIVSHNCFAYGEDSDLSLRMREAGYTIHQANFKLITHIRAATSSKVPGILKIQEQNHVYLRKRWGHYLRTRKFDYPIIVQRMGAHGDVLLITPILRALKEQRPFNPIFVRTSVPDVLHGNPHIVRASAGINNPMGAMQINLDGTYEKQPDRHFVTTYAEAAGVEVPRPYKTEIFPSAGDVAWATTKIPDDKWVAIHPGPSTWKGKEWPKDRFEFVAKTLREDGWRVVLVGSADVGIPNDLDLRGRTSIMQMAAAIQRCRLFIGLDSLPMHISQAVGTPTIGLFGITDPQYISTDGSWFHGVKGTGTTAGQRHRTVGKTHVNDNGVAMNTIPVDEVLRVIRERLCALQPTT